MLYAWQLVRNQAARQKKIRAITEEVHGPSEGGQAER